MVELIEQIQYQVLDRRTKGQNNSRHNNRITVLDNKDRRTKE